MLDETGLYAPEMLLDGDLPSPLNPPDGCKFHTRCKYATAICGEVEPVLEGVSGEHFARCHRWQELG
jgi:peptide/nickel transport system ATP-binding protein